MVPDSSLSRRQLLAAGGSAAALLTGGFLARRQFETAAAAPTGGWPMAGRDPAGTGYAPDADPPTADVAVRWKYPLAAAAEYWPGPVTADGVVYAVGTDVLGVSASDGERLLRVRRETDTAPAVAPGRAYRTRTAAVLETSTFDPGGLVGVHGRGEGAIAGVQVEETRWTATVESMADSYSRVHYGGGLRPPPIPVGDTLLTFLRGTLAAVDASSGAIEWTSDDTLPAVRPAVRDGTAYVADRNGGIRGYDVATGEWSALDVTGRVSSLTATPQHLVVSGTDGIRALSADGRVEWQVSSPAEDEPSGPVAVANGTIYARLPTDDGPRVGAIDADDGERRWESPVVPADSSGFLPAVADGIAAVPVADSGLAGIDTADGSVRWQFDPGNEAASPAALAGDALYVVTDEHLYALEEP